MTHIIYNNESYIRVEDAKKIIKDTANEYDDLVEELELRIVRLTQLLPYYAKVNLN